MHRCVWQASVPCCGHMQLPAAASFIRDDLPCSGHTLLPDLPLAKPSDEESNDPPQPPLDVEEIAAQLPPWWQQVRTCSQSDCGRCCTAQAARQGAALPSAGPHAGAHG